MPEYINPNNHTVYLVGPNGDTVKIGAGQRKVLPEFFDRYRTKGYLLRVENGTNKPSPNRRIAISAKRPIASVPTPPSVVTPRAPRRALGVRREQKEVAQKPQKQHKKIVSKAPPKQRTVGRRINEDATQLLRTNLRILQYPISNNIGVGILSYNRHNSLRRLVESIKKNTDLRCTTVFISDDASTDAATQLYLDELANNDDIIIIRNKQRLGVAGNTNRLMRCLARFKYCILLNDDVEILQSGWESLYAKAMSAGAIKQFCMHQPGIYGAKNANTINIGGMELFVVNDKPHGAILAYTNEVYDRIGYFDERFGIYGMEHVDWSSRVCHAGLQPAGYYDVVVAGKYFTIHNEKSAVENREKYLQEARKIMSEIDRQDHYVAASPASAVPIISCIIPCRELERHGGITTVIDGIRAQRFPAIDIIVSEHDTHRKVSDVITPITHKLTQSDGRPFNKAKAFNAGVALAKSPFLALHDADLLVPGCYLRNIYDILQSYEACHCGKTVIYLSQGSSNTVNTMRLVDISADCERVVGYFEGGSLACRRRTYWTAGGFCEDFWGYGVEDCEFYDRLMHNSNWKEDRKFDFVHLWHGRSPSWNNEHQHNKDLGHKLASAPMAQRIQSCYAALRSSGYAEQVDAALKGTI